MTEATASLPTRRLIYALLITVAVAAAAGRILNAQLVYEPVLFRDAEERDPTHRVWPKKRPEPMPAFSSNDVSRWDTIRALVDRGTFVIGERDRNVVVGSAVSCLGASTPGDLAVLQTAGYQARIGSDRGIVTQPGWGTVDKVLNPETLQFYSSKPPLLPTLVAGEYWVLQKAFGWKLASPPGSPPDDQRWEVVRVILFTVNGLPWLVYLLVLARLVERYGTTDWGRFFVLAAGCFGTLLTAFLITLNNHTLAACCALFALAPFLTLLEQPAPGQRWRYLVAGFFAGFTACNELPAAAFAGLLFAVLLVREPRRTLVWFLPAALLPVIAFFVTNYLAIGELVPAYEKFGGPWYEYEGSHWRRAEGQVKYGIDWARLRETRATYALHLLVGHHGLFSLTPIFLLAVIGTVAVLVRWHRPAPQKEQPGLLASRYDSSAFIVLAGITLLLTIIVVGFYLFKSDNYGGWTSGPRWLMWLTPLWLLTMLPVVDWLATRHWGRGLAYGLLALSVLSASYPAWNPWRHPWIYTFMEGQGWIRY